MKQTSIISGRSVILSGSYCPTVLQEKTVRYSGIRGLGLSDNFTCYIYFTSALDLKKETHTLFHLVLNLFRLPLLHRDTKIDKA